MSSMPQIEISSYYNSYINRSKVMNSVRTIHSSSVTGVRKSVWIFHSVSDSDSISTFYAYRIIRFSYFPECNEIHGNIGGALLPYRKLFNIARVKYEDVYSRVVTFLRLIEGLFLLTINKQSIDTNIMKPRPTINES